MIIYGEKGALKISDSQGVSFYDIGGAESKIEIDEGIKLVASDLMSKKRFMIEKLGYIPETADEEIRRIAEEKKISASIVDTVLFSATE